LQLLFVGWACALTVPAFAEEPDEPADAEPAAAPPDVEKPAAAAPTPAVAAAAPNTKEAATPPDATPAPPPAKPWYQEWHTEVTGYFRAPISMGISSRPNPDDMKGPKHSQVSYGPNRTIDSSYWSFAYTRLQEQDWAEVFIHEKHKHAEAVVGWMGYWFQAVGFRNPDAAWAPGVAYLTLDTDFDVAAIKPNIALTVGAFWPGYGYFAKYDTFTLGRFRQIGEQAKLTLPLGPDLNIALVQGFGTGRDGSFNYLAPPFYGAITGLDLLAWANLRVSYKKLLDVGLHISNQWTSDPNLAQGSTPGPKSYTAVSDAHLSVMGAEANVSAPYLGHLWVSPSVMKVRNGWAIASTGTEVMHSLGGAGVATNYLGWTNSPSDSTGSGSIFNLGFMYENSLSTLRGEERGKRLPDVTVSAFGLLASSSLDLPTGSTLPYKSIKQFKWGADATLQALQWLGVMARFDSVTYDLDHPGYIFSAITGRLIFSSHFLSSESIYLQYSRYRYGDKMVLNGSWPWGAPLVAGSNVLQQGPYSGTKPDMDVLKLQAEIAF
jgi:hypothetical protein